MTKTWKNQKYFPRQNNILQKLTFQKFPKNNFSKKRYHFKTIFFHLPFNYRIVFGLFKIYVKPVYRLWQPYLLCIIYLKLIIKIIIINFIHLSFSFDFEIYSFTMMIYYKQFSRKLCNYLKYICDLVKGYYKNFTRVKVLLLYEKNTL